MLRIHDRIRGARVSSSPKKPSDPVRCADREAPTQWLAVALGVLPLYSISIFLQLRRAQPPTLAGLVFYLAVVSPLAIVVVLLLLRYLCRENLRDLDRKPGKPSSDLLAALVLSLGILVANVVSNFVLSGLLPSTAPRTGIGHLFVEAARSPGRFALFVGPLVFLGAASEEIVRVFLLTRLWKVWPSGRGRGIAVALSAGLFGLLHFYRGPAHVAWTTLLGLILALHYLRFGRVLPLILAHYLTNAIQVVLGVVLRG
jgi:membrane protease YdiL (CAAX protease family)